MGDVFEFAIPCHPFNPQIRHLLILSRGISPRGTPGDPSPEWEKLVRLPNSGHQFTADDRDLKDDGRGSNPILGQVIASRANNARGNRRSDWWRNLCFAHRHAIQNRGPNMYYLPEILWRNKGDSSLLWASGDHI